MKQLQQQVKKLQKEIRDLQSFVGVLVPVFEKEYKKGGWNFSKR